MSRRPRWGWLFLGCLVALAPRATADEPTLKGRTLGDWLKMLESDPKPERRQAALIAIELLGAKAPPAVRGIGKAARTDASEDVRRQAAQLLGSLGGDAREALDDLVAVLKSDTNAGVRESAAGALGKI